MAIKKFPISQERLEEIIKEYPTPFHIYDEKSNFEQIFAVLRRLLIGLLNLENILQ